MRRRRRHPTRASCRRHACRGRSGAAHPSGHPPRSRSPGRGEGGRDPTPTPGAKGRQGRNARPAVRPRVSFARLVPARPHRQRHGRSRRPRAVEAGAVGIIAKSLRVEPVANHRRTTAGDRAAEGVEDQPACAGLDVRGKPARTSIDQLTQHDCGHRPPHTMTARPAIRPGILTWNVAGRDLAVQPTARTAVALLQDPPRPTKVGRQDRPTAAIVHLIDAGDADQARAGDQHGTVGPGLTDCRWATTSSVQVS